MRYLTLNTVDEQEEVIQVASGRLGREGFAEWLGRHIVKKVVLAA